MKNFVMIGTASLVLAACGGGGETVAAEAEAEPVNALEPGQYEVVREVTALDTADNSVPRTPLAVGDSNSVNVCVGEDGALPAAAFAEGDDDCGIENPYARRGTLRQSLRCDRSGEAVMLNVDGDFTADSVTARVESETFFRLDGDYKLTRNLTATRTGDCPAAEGDAAAEG